MKSIVISCVLSIALLAHIAPARAFAEPLPALNADLSQTTVSGISSGGFMAAQIATTHSSRFMGVGIIAAGPYYCAGSNGSGAFLAHAMAFCMAPVSSAVGPSGAAAYKHAERLAAAGAIDPVEGVRRQRVYVFSGMRDRTVKTVVADETVAFYRRAGVPDGQLLYVRHPDAVHAIVTANPDDTPCGVERAPYINNCSFWQSHALLRQLYPERRQAALDDASGTMTGRAPGRLVMFDQSPFLQGERTSMDRDGYAYVPAACAERRCAVHVAFHGCVQGKSVVGDRFAAGAGYNAYAAANDIIVLYPQVRAGTLPPNPNGCWDFWGYSSRDAFHTKAAPQMRAVMAMLDRLGQSAQPAQSAQP